MNVEGFLPMIPGGQTNPTQVKKQLEDLRAKQDAIQPQVLDGQEEQGQLTQNANDAQLGTKHAGEIYSEVYGDANVAETEANTAEARVRNATDTVDAAAKNVDDFNNNNKNARLDIKPMLERAKNAWDMFHFYQQTFDKEFFGKYTLSCLEKVLDNMVFGGKALVSFHAACMIMSAAMTGTTTRVSAQLLIDPMFRVHELPRNQAPEQGAQAQQQSNEYESALKKIEEKEADPYYTNKLATEQSKLADEKAKLNSAHAELAGLEARKADAKRARDAADTEYQNATKVARAKAEEVARLDAEYKDLSREQQRIIDDYNMKNTKKGKKG